MVAVIGAGIIGSWAALHLVESGVKTTLIEQFPLPHTRGSSHGLSRAFRLLGDHELDRLDYSLERWLGLEKLTGETLFIKTGLLNFGFYGDPDLEKFMAVVRNGGRPCEWLGSEAITARFPMLHYPQEWGAAWDPNGGILLAHRCLNAVQSRFLALGGRIVTGRVESVESTSGAGARIRMQSGISGKTATSGFDTAVVCAGPWTSKLLPQLAGLLNCQRIPVTYWRDNSGNCSVSKGFPILFNARLTGIYGLPSCEYKDLVKILFHGGPETDPDTRDLVSFESYVNKIRRYVSEHLPLLDHRQPAILESCMYTVTPDSEPILDRLDSNLVIACGFSGSGFKHSPATGRMLAAFALDQGGSLPERFRADRYVLDRFK
jgi:sarcosine oxidase/L-pipecolate oxidase